MCFVSLGRGPDPRVRPLRQLVNPPPRDTQHHLADWPTRQPAFCRRLVSPPSVAGRSTPRRRLVNFPLLHDLLLPSGPRSPPPPPRPPRPPSQLASPPLPCRRSPEGEPLWHHRATRGLPGVGYPPGARPSTTLAQAGVVHNRPRDTAMPP